LSGITGAAPGVAAAKSEPQIRRAAMLLIELNVAGRRFTRMLGVRRRAVPRRDRLDARAA